MSTGNTPQSQSSACSVPPTANEFAQSLARLRSARAHSDRRAAIEAAVEVAGIYVDAGGTDRVLDSWREPAANSAARFTARVIAPVTFLTAAIAVALMGTTPTLTAIHGLLTDPELSAAARKSLHLPIQERPAADRVLDGHRLVLTIGSVTRAFTALAQSCEAALYPSDRALTAAEADHIDQWRDPDRTAVLQNRLDVLTGRLCTTAMQLLPSAVRDASSGDVTIDRLGVPVASRAIRTLSAPKCKLPREANAWLYFPRTLSSSDAKTSIDRYRPELGYIATIAVMGTSSEGQPGLNLIAGLSLNRALPDDVAEILTVLRGLDDAQARIDTVFDLHRRNPDSAQRLRIALASHGYSVQLRATVRTTGKRLRRAQAQARAARLETDNPVWAYEAPRRRPAVSTATDRTHLGATSGWYTRDPDLRTPSAPASAARSTASSTAPIVREGRFTCPATPPAKLPALQGARTARQPRTTGQAERAVHRLQDTPHSLIRQPSQRHYYRLAKHTLAVAIDIAVHNIDTLASFYATHPELDPSFTAGGFEPVGSYRGLAPREPYRIAGRPGLNTPRTS